MPSVPPADVTVVMPTYNEHDGLEALVHAIFQSSDARRLALELVIVDDNSPDGTGDLADALARRYRMRVVHRAGKLGLGTAVMEGFRAASADIVCVMDGDFSHPPAMVPELYRAFVATGADVVVGSRYIPGGATPDWPARRRAMSRVGCWLARGLTPIKDATSGFFMIRRDLAERTTINASGFKIGMELMVRSGATSLVEVPYTFVDRQVGASKMTTREGLGYLVQLMKLYWTRMTHRRPRLRYQCMAAPAVEPAVVTHPAGR